MLSALAVLGLTSASQANQVVKGTVLDSISGQPVEGAEVRIEGSGYAALTDSRGGFALASVPQGTWSLTVTRLGFRPFGPHEIEVDEGYYHRHHILLTPAPVVLPPHRVERQASQRQSEAAVRRYTREEIIRAGHRSIAEALDAVPGVRVYGSSETPGGTRVSVGGESPKRVAILLDGLPLATGTDGAVSLDPIPLSAIHVVEVRSGAQSALAGDAAVGGVVNLVTAPSLAEPSNVVELRGGSFGTYQGSATGWRRWESFSGQLVYERSGHGDDFRYPDADSSALRRGVSAEGVRAFLGLSSRRASGWRMSAYTFHQDLGVPGALEQLTPGAQNGREHRRVQSRCGFRWSPIQFESAVWYESSRERYHSPQFFRQDSEFRERFFGGRLQMVSSVAAVRVGVEAEFRGRRLQGIDRIRPDSSFGVQHRTEAVVRGRTRVTQSLAGVEAIVAASAAIDADDLSKPVMSPRLDFGFATPVGVTLRAGWGRSFRRPPLTALFWKADVFSAGNPNLRPERASEWDIGFRATRGPLTSETRYFNRRVTDIIVWERDFTGKYKPKNVSFSTTIGHEDHIGFDVPGGFASIDYTHVFQDARDRSGEVNHDGYVLILMPRHTHDLEVNLNQGRWDARLRARWVSLRYTRRMNDRGKTLPAYRSFGSFIRLTARRLRPTVQMSLHLDNLTNERIELLERYPLPGRSVSLATTIRF